MRVRLFRQGAALDASAGDRRHNTHGGAAGLTLAPPSRTCVRAPFPRLQFAPRESESATYVPKATARASELVTRYRREAPKLATKVPQRNVGLPCLRLFYWRGKDCCPGPAGPHSGNDRFRRRISVPAGTCINCSNASGSWSGSRTHDERSACCGRTGEEQ